MRPLKIFVCEDEELQLKMNCLVVMEYLQKRHIKAEFLSRAGYLVEDDEFLKSVEIAILDIDLGEVNGIELARKMRQLNPHVVVIFVTAYERFSLEATQIYLSGFLHKPLNPLALQDTLERAIVQVQGYRAIKRNRRMAAFQNGKIILPERTIISLEKIPNTKELKLTTTSETIQFYDTIRHAEKQLSDSFIKLNRSVIVNLSHIARVEHDTVSLQNGTTHHISNRQAREVQKAYLRFLSEQ